jgi:hypothetical protein
MANAKNMTAITYNGSTIATLNGGQTATLKCAGKKMESDVVVDVAEMSEIGGGSSGDITVMPLTVTENGVYDILYETATEVWDSNTEYAGSVTVDGVTLSFKKAEHLIVPDDLDELTNLRYTTTLELDGDVFERTLNDGLDITRGVFAVFAEYALLWVKSAAPLNVQFGVSFIEDNTVYITNYLPFMAQVQEGASYCKVSVTAPSKKIENVAYRPVTVELPISEDDLYITPLINRATVYDFDRTGQYYKYVQVNAIADNLLMVTPKPTRQELVPQDDTKPFTKVIVEPVDTSSVTTQHLLCGIYIKTMPKTEYKVGEWFDSRGGVLLAQYTDGSTEDIRMRDVENNGMEIYGFGSDYPGVIPLRVEYTEGAITSKTVYNITIKEDTGDDDTGDDNTGGDTGGDDTGGDSGETADYTVSVGDYFGIAYEGNSPAVECPSCLEYQDDGGELVFTGVSVGSGTIKLIRSSEVYAEYTVEVTA